MLNQLEEIEQAALVALDEVEDEQAMEQWRVANLGRSSPLMAVFDQMRDLPKDERPAIGRRSNEVKQKLEKKYSEKADLINQVHSSNPNMTKTQAPSTRRCRDYLKCNQIQP